MKIIALIIPAAVIILASCRSTRNIQTAISKKDTIPLVRTDTLQRLNADSIAFIENLYEEFNRSRIDFTTFSAKVDVDYEDGEGKKYDVNAHIRMYKDSVIWITITAILGIEGLRVLITEDSVKLLGKQNKIYTARSVSFLQDVTALPLDLKTLQDLLIGNAVFLGPVIQSYSNQGTTISMLTTGDFFKHLLTINASDRKIRSSKLDDIDETRNRTCLLTYSEYEDKRGVPFATRRTINVTEKKKLDIRLDFKQYEFNETLSFPFSIPKNYTSE